MPTRRWTAETRANNAQRFPGRPLWIQLNLLWTDIKPVTDAKRDGYASCRHVIASTIQWLPCTHLYGGLTWAISCYWTTNKLRYLLLFHFHGHFPPVTRLDGSLPGLPPLVLDQDLWEQLGQVTMSRMPFLSPNQQRWNTEGNNERTRFTSANAADSSGSASIATSYKLYHDQFKNTAKPR